MFCSISLSCVCSCSLSRPVRSHAVPLGRRSLTDDGLVSHLILHCSTLFHVPCFPCGTILRRIDTSNRKFISFPSHRACLLAAWLSVPAHTNRFSNGKWLHLPCSVFTETEQLLKLTTRQIFAHKTKRFRVIQSLLVLYFTDTSSLFIFLFLFLLSPVSPLMFASNDV
jgi:hypothetical protein